ncbi:MAG: creatininase family protein [Chitinophagaceae bacterium]
MSTASRPYILQESSWNNLKGFQFETAILPWGATEAHNYHLPYGTDNYQVQYVAEKTAELAWGKGAKLTVLPAIHYGVNTGQLDINLCMNLNPSTQLAILKDICEVLTRHRIKKLVILNGHGANNFIAIIRELYILFPDLFVTVINWFQASKKDMFQEPGDHADEMETSVMMHIMPHLVDSLEIAGDGVTKKFNLKGFKEGWAWSQRPWTKITKDTGSGNPFFATQEKGKLFLQNTIDNIADFLYELTINPIDNIIK